MGVYRQPDRGQTRAPCTLDLTRTYSRSTLLKTTSFRILCLLNAANATGQHALRGTGKRRPLMATQPGQRVNYTSLAG